MFAKKNRFSFRRGAPRQTLHTPFFVLAYQKNTDSQFRCAVVVGKKVDKRAVARNTVKRKIVSILEEITKDKKIGFELVFFIRKEINTIIENRDEIKKHLEEALLKTHIL